MYTALAPTVPKAFFGRKLTIAAAAGIATKSPHVEPPLVVAALATFPAILSVTAPLKPASIHEVEVQSFLYSFSWLVFLKIRLTKTYGRYIEKKFKVP